MNKLDTSDRAIQEHKMTEALRDEEADDCFGQFKGFHYAARLLDVHAILTLDRIKTEKLYERKNDPETGKPYAWNAACTKRLGLTHTKANDMIGMYHQYGREFLEAVQGLRLPRRTVRLLLDAPPDLQADVLAIQEAPEDDRQELLDKLVEKNTKQACVIEELEHDNKHQQEEIQQRKKGSARDAEWARDRERRIRELESGWAPSDEEAAAMDNLQLEKTKISMGVQRICLQIDALPDSGGLHTVGKGIRDDLQGFADIVADAVLDAINKTVKAKGKQ